MLGYIEKRAVQIYVVTHDGRLWLFRRCSKHSIGRWEVPTGKCDPGESFLDAAQRELSEEAGLTLPLDRFMYQCTITTPSTDELDIAWTVATYGVVLSPEETPVLNEPQVHDLLQKFDNIEVIRLPKTMVFDMSESIRKIWTNKNDYV